MKKAYKTLLTESDFKALNIAFSNWYEEHQNSQSFPGYYPFVGAMYNAFLSRPKDLDGDKVYECFFDKSAMSFVLDHIIYDVFCPDDENSILMSFCRALLSD